MGIDIYFTGKLRHSLEKLNASASWRCVEEIRLRINRPVMVLGDGKIFYLTGEGELKKDVTDALICHREDLDRCLELMSDYSLYAFNEEIKNGFITLPGGHRVGICGQAVCDNGEVKQIKNIQLSNFSAEGSLECDISLYTSPSGIKTISIVLAGDCGCGRSCFTPHLQCRLIASFVLL